MSGSERSEVNKVRHEGQAGKQTFDRLDRVTNESATSLVPEFNLETCPHQRKTASILTETACLALSIFSRSLLFTIL